MKKEVDFSTPFNYWNNPLPISAIKVIILDKLKTIIRPISNDVKSLFMSAFLSAGASIYFNPTAIIPAIETIWTTITIVVHKLPDISWKLLAENKVSSSPEKKS